VNAQEILARARRQEAIEESVRRPIDYARMKREYPRQRAALTRAKNSGDPDKVVLACAAAVKAWDEIGCWPDSWSSWQIALDDALGWGHQVRLENLR
jgi:hypothetical protein